MGLSMRADIKERWIAELRSGEHEQGRCALHKVEGDLAVERFCCLGILAQMCHQEGAVQRATDDHTGLAEASWRSDGSTTYRYGDSTNYLPKQVIEWAGIRWSEEGVHVDPEAEGRYGLVESMTLARANDSGLTFEEIAGIIEREVEGV